MIYDLAILGGGPAGVAAGVYAARKWLSTIYITKDWNGQSSVSEGVRIGSVIFKIPASSSPRSLGTISRLMPARLSPSKKVNGLPLLLRAAILLP